MRKFQLVLISLLGSTLISSAALAQAGAGLRVDPNCLPRNSAAQTLIPTFDRMTTGSIANVDAKGDREVTIRPAIGDASNSQFVNRAGKSDREPLPLRPAFQPMMMMGIL